MKASLLVATISTLLFASQALAQDFTLSSGDIAPNATIADEQVFNGFGCSGQNVSPSLSWSGGKVRVFIRR